MTAGYLLYCFLYTPNFLLSIPIVFFPLVAYRLFWISEQPNILFWGMLLQWVTAAVQLLYCNIFGISLEEKLRSTPIYSKNIEMATWLNIVGVYAFAFGMYLAVLGLRKFRVRRESLDYDPRRIIILYITISLGMYLTQGLIWVFPGLSQFLYILFYLKWGFFMITFYAIHKQAPFLRIYFYALTGFELVVGLSSFFAGQIIITVLFFGMAIVHIQPKLSIRLSLVLVVVGIILFHYLVLWSAVKREYREFVNQGTVAQSVLVSSDEARIKLFELMNKVDGKKYKDGIETLVNRLGYIQFFSACLDYVPRVVPHQYGSVYSAAFQHYLIPRILNPNKPILDDSKHTTEFTGIQLSGVKEGSSFSLGYIADAYVDFGPVFMHVLLFVLGWFFGLTYNILVRKCSNDVWIWIITSPYLLLLNINGADTHKAVGSLMLYFLSILIVKGAMTRLVESFLRPSI